MRRIRRAASTARARFGPLLADLSAVGVSLLVAVASVLSTPRWVEVPRWVVVVAGIVGTVALLGRRRWPVAVTVAGVAVFLLSENPVALVVGLYTTAVRARDRVLVGTSALAAAGFATFDALDHGRVNPGSIVSGVFQAALVVAVGSYVGARRDLLATLRDRAERAEAEREIRADRARSAERARIAREMHDVLAHKVSLIALHAGALEVNAHAGAGPVEEAASLIRVTAHEALEELREVLGVLRSGGPDERADLVPPPTADDIARLVEASRLAGVEVSLVDDAPGLPDAVARAAHRVVQEGLTNVHKHARGARTEVVIRGDERSGVTVAVVNRAPVASELIGGGLPGAGAGLVGLAERVRLLGGTFAGGPAVGGGWELRAWLPWHGQADALVGSELSGVPHP